MADQSFAHVSHYEAVISELEQTKSEVEDGIRALKRLASRMEPRVLSVASLSDDGRSTPNRLIELLLANPSRTFKVEDIAKEMSDVRRKTLRGALDRMFQKGKIERLGRGRYGLPK